MVRVTGFEPAGGPAAPALPAAADCTRIRRQEAAGSAGTEKKRKSVLLTEYGLEISQQYRCQCLQVSAQNQIEAQRSGFDLERRSKEAGG